MHCSRVERVLKEWEAATNGEHKESKSSLQNIFLEKGFLFMLFFMAHHWEKGTRTEKNQDSLAIGQMVVRRKRCLLIVVCDGIGSFANSEEASGFVTEQMLTRFYRAGPRLFGGFATSRGILSAGRRALYRINQQLQEEAESPIGCTSSMLLFVNRCFFIWNIGDSRIYRGRRGCYRQLTKDDVCNGKLTKCIGTFTWKGVSTGWGRIRKKDRFLVCSDGFYQKMSEQNLRELLTGKRDVSPDRLSGMLGEAARRCRMRGETDDQTSVLVQAEWREYE